MLFEHFGAAARADSERELRLETPGRVEYTRVSLALGCVVTTNTAVFFGEMNRSARKRPPLSSGTWTLVGGLAIPLWATWPALSLRTRGIPTFECLAIIFVCAWVTLRLLQRPTNHAGVPTAIPSMSWVPALAFAVCESLAAALFLVSTHYITPAEANLITYLWPGMIVAFGALLGIFRLRLRHVVGIVTGFAGVSVITWGGPISLSYAGIGLAFLGGVSWAVYCVFRLYWKRSTGPFLALGCGLSALICAALSLVAETSVLPSIQSLAVAAVIGVVPTAVANLAWDEGFRKGDSHLLAIMAYGTPLCSTLLLILLGVESPSWRLFAGAIGIAIAGVLSRTET
jgi:drug/metabolite transporter (DMT)-like permease